MAEVQVLERVRPWERRFGCGFFESKVLWGQEVSNVVLSGPLVRCLVAIGKVAAAPDLDRGGYQLLLPFVSSLHAGVGCWTANFDLAKSLHCSSAEKAAIGVDHPWLDQWVATLGRTECSTSSNLQPGIAMRIRRSAEGAGRCVELAIGNVHRPESGRHGSAWTQWT